ncbi:MAG: PAAR domain-containing protein [Bacteroidota bacterium]
MPPAARLTDMHACPAFTGTVAHGSGSIVGPGIATVLIENKPAAVMGDMVACIGPPATIVKGSGTVLIGGKPAARVGDSTNHGGSILPPGCLTVIIGG